MEFPAHASAIDVRSGDANKTIRDLCNTWDKKGTRGVLFLDPFGMQAEWSTIEAIAGTGCIDTWILFPFAANRLCVAFFFKQWGGVNKKKTGRVLDGQTYDEMPTTSVQPRTRSRTVIAR